MSFVPRLKVTSWIAHFMKNNAALKLDDVREVDQRVPDPAQQRAWLTFTIVGAAPAGVELAGAFGENARQTH